MKAISRQTTFIRFIVTASILYLALYFIHQFVIKRYTYYDQKFIGSIISASDWILNSIGFKTFSVLQDRDLQVIGIDGSNGVWVGSNCNAISLFSLFSVFVIAYPGPLKHKLWYIPVCIIAIHVINILRVVALAIIADKAPVYLDFNHTYTFTFLVYAFIFFLWMVWVNRYSVISNPHVST